MSGANTSATTDVYAAGVLLYCLLVGSYPFFDVNEALADKWVRPHRANLQVPIAVTRIAERALALDPAARFQNAGQMLQELASQRIRGSWREMAGSPGHLMAWESGTAYAPYEVTIRQRNRDFEIQARHRGGGRLRRARLNHKPTLAAAKQSARSLLLEVVDGGAL